MNRFDECVNVVIGFEGGFSDHPQDRGGKTKYGITEATLNAAFSAGLVSHNNIKELSVDEAKIIYKANYWDKCKCGNLPRPLDMCVFDAAVHHGVGTSSKFLQEAMNKIVGADILVIDGIIGPMTLGVIEGWLTRYKNDCSFPIVFICDRFIDRRLKFCSNIVANDGSQLKFLHGWLNRVLKLKEEIVNGWI